MSPAGEEMSVHDKVSIVWVALSLAIATLGELYLSPVGLSFVSKVAPSYMTSLAVGCWMLASFGGNMLAGHLGTMYVALPTLSLSLSSDLTLSFAQRRYLTRNIAKEAAK